MATTKKGKSASASKTMKASKLHKHLTTSQVAAGLWFATTMVILVFGIVLGLFISEKNAEADLVNGVQGVMNGNGAESYEEELDTIKADVDELRKDVEALQKSVR